MSEYKPLSTGLSPIKRRVRRRSHTVCSSSVSSSSWDGGAAAAAAVPAQTAPAESSETMQSFLVFLVELGLIAMGIVDTLMVGWCRSTVRVRKLVLKAPMG